MKLTTRSEYALLALICLARHKPGEYINGETIAQEQAIPQKFLQQILLTLKNARYVYSQKGQHGGYRLSKTPDTIMLAEIVRLFDGALAPTESVSTYFYESTPVEKETKLIAVFKDIRDYVSTKLENTTIADVL
ncbi:MAG TPA: Rrf2 family transcriptional regulator [Candidatus Hydrogenedentes bacterium]|nr:Rrf2 family transcriptional regulator [Candidatus Hydrogenedentota bacterium]